MGKLFPKKLLQWREPQAVVRQGVREALKAFRPRVIFPCIALCVVVLIVVINHIDPEHETEPLMKQLILFVIGSVLFVYFPRLFLFLPSWVTLYEKQIVTSTGNSGSAIHVSDITTCELSSVMTEDGTFPVLRIKTVRSKPQSSGRIVGIPPDRVPNVLDTLAAMGVNVGRN